ncbi:hypothetical protein ABNX05_17810 [Lysinibacillus sp. M3]|uniref:Uncharacterized protein n=1 Tax=Lysinibacillus zambalensis TaxID=3160866 RepID=A0ABV1MVD7_9BACI
MYSKRFLCWCGASNIGGSVVTKQDVTAFYRALDEGKYYLEDGIKNL